MPKSQLFWMGHADEVRYRVLQLFANFGGVITGGIAFLPRLCLGCI